MRHGTLAFIQFPNGADNLSKEAWAGIPVTDRDLLMYAVKAANQEALTWFSNRIVSGCTMETAISFILRGIPWVDVIRRISRRLFPLFKLLYTYQDIFWEEGNPTL
jgi:hypothetical protein